MGARVTARERPPPAPPPRPTVLLPLRDTVTKEEFPRLSGGVEVGLASSGDLRPLTAALAAPLMSEHTLLLLSSMLTRRDLPLLELLGPEESLAAGVGEPILREFRRDPARE